MKVSKKAAPVSSFIKKVKRKWILILIDLLFFVFAYTSATFIGYLSDGKLSLEVPMMLANFAILGCTAFFFRLCFNIYSNVWRYANSKAYLLIVISDILSGISGFLITKLSGIEIDGWRTIFVITAFSLLTLLSRFAYQQLYQYRNTLQNANEITMNKIGVAIVGAGQIGVLLADELNCNPNSHYKPVCFVDTDESKVGSRICGLKVYKEDGDKIINTLKSLPVQEIFIALPRIDSETAGELHAFYSQTGCKVKLYDFPINADDSGSSDKRVVREIKIEDLLFRSAIEINDDTSKAFYSGKKILVTGGGGSIGSELCRQLAKCSPAKLIIFDIYENNAYDIQQSLIRKYGDKLDLAVEIGSVRDRDRLNSVFENYRPDIVFHAAAHKHVPLMEHSCGEAIKNNVLGTYNVADMAEKYEAEKFIMISTDKAVNPTNIMGASKRMCEMIVQSRIDSKTSFSAVRFGNVLGSNGSVIPLFKNQIAKGGPVTITDKRIIRYFMTIPEASQLVIQAGAMAKSGELFVLDMGKPVKILELAENMIRLSGFTPYVDIDIKEIGLRPGEKLYEELLIKSETLGKTDNKMIFIEKDKPLSREEVDKKIEKLCKAVEQSKDELESDMIKNAMKEAVPTYHDPDEVNCHAESTTEMKICV